MERKEFLKSIGAGAAFTITFACLGGCLREEIDPALIPDANATDTSNTGSSGTNTTNNTNTTTSSSVLFSIDLNASEASKLAANGGFIVKKNIVVARNLNGQFVAATVICSHDLIKKVTFRNNEYYCTEHGARFDQTGKGLNNDGKKGLKIYKTALNGSILDILS